MKFNMKKMIATSCALLTSCMLLSTEQVQASSAPFKSTTKNTSKIKIEEVEYDLKNSFEAIELEFKHYINLNSSASVLVKDNLGNTYEASINDYFDDDDFDDDDFEDDDFDDDSFEDDSFEDDSFDDDEFNDDFDALYESISLDVDGLTAGRSYTVTISDIKNSFASKYGTLTVKFSIPKASSISVKEVSYDYKDREVTFDFNQDVTYKNAKVVITNEDGSRKYKTGIVEREDDELTIRVKGLKYGRTYMYTITGVKGLGASSSQTISGSFIAIDND